MRHLLSGVLAVSGLLLISATADAQYQYQYRDQQHREYDRGNQYRSPITAIENTLAANRVSVNSMLSADKWNYYASETFRGFTPPAPETLFPWLANVASSQQPYQNAAHDPVSFSTWWNATRPYLENSQS